MKDIISLFLEDYTFRTITLGTALLGLVSGMLGSFAVLRKESLMGDAISHAALPGIAVAFLLTGAKSSGILLIGAVVSALLAAYWIRKIVSDTHLKSDTALGLVLSVFFGFGILLLTFIQKLPDANQAGLDKFLFGQAATLVFSDVLILLVITIITGIVLMLFWKEIKITLFDPEYARSIGVNIKNINRLITFLIVIAIVLGLQTVGVVLMSAILLAPAAAARQWTNRLATMILLAGGIGAISGMTGTAISATGSNLATGPVIVLVANVFVVMSLSLSPTRGILFHRIEFYRNKQNLQLLKTLYTFYHNPNANIKTESNQLIFNNLNGTSDNLLKKMAKKGWIKSRDNTWYITEHGIKELTLITGR